MSVLRSPGASPTVSVVLSCYNGEPWLSEAIESVLAQTYGDFEFIIIDDGSRDGSWLTIQRFAGLDSRISCFTKPNSGTSDSLNRGIARARGGLVARLDADDVCEPDRLARQVAFMERHPSVVLLGSGFSEIDESGRVLRVHSYPREHRALARNLERLQRFFPSSSAMFRTASFRRVRGGFNQRLPLTQDWGMWFELLLLGDFACLPEALVRIRKHGAQVSNTGAGRAQFRESVADAACHRLRLLGERDPSVDGDSGEWEAFLTCVDQHVESSGVFRRQKHWMDAREGYIRATNRVVGGLRAAATLLRSVDTIPLLWQKAFGTTVGTKVAADWRRRSLTARGQVDAASKYPR